MYLKFLKKCSLSLCIATVILGGSTALAAETPITVNNPQVKVYVQGTDTVFPNEQGVFMPAINYNGSTYIPVRSAGEWMGKQVSWDAATQTVSLSGNQDAVVHPSEEASVTGAVRFGEFSSPHGGTAEASLCPDISVSLDGKVQTFKNEQGTVIYPIRMANVTYLPLRSIGELTGYEVTWEEIKDDPILKGNIYLRTGLSEDERNSLLQYADTLLVKMQELDKLVSDSRDSAFEAVTSADGTTITTLAKPDVAVQAIPKIKAKAEEIKGLDAPSGTLLTYYYQRISKSLDNIIENADSVLAKAKAGDKIVLGGAADSSRDEEAVLVFNTSYSMQIDAELMKQMVTQKMQLN